MLITRPLNSIKATRIAHGLSETELANRADVPDPIITGLECGLLDILKVKPVEINRLSVALDLDKDQILKEYTLRNTVAQYISRLRELDKSQLTTMSSLMGMYKSPIEPTIEEPSTMAVDLFYMLKPSGVPVDDEILYREIGAAYACQKLRFMDSQRYETLPTALFKIDKDDTHDDEPILENVMNSENNEGLLEIEDLIYKAWKRGYKIEFTSLLGDLIMLKDPDMATYVGIVWASERNS